MQLRQADPKLFFHSRAALKARLDEEEAKAEPDTALAADLATALQFVDEDYGGQIADFERLVSFGEITFDLLWAFFEPNTLVHHFHEYSEQDQLLLMRIVKYRQREDMSTYLNVVCEVISCDGKTFGVARVRSLEIDEYQGARKIHDLSVIPLKYFPNANSIRDEAIRRGKRFTQMATHAVSHTYHEISGPAIKEEVGDDWEVKLFKFNVRAPSCTCF
jgi:hypothetical protein